MASFTAQEFPKAIVSSPLQRLCIQTRTELILTLRRGESILIAFVIPVMLLIFFTSLRLVPGSRQSVISWYLPGMLAIAIMSTGMVSLGIATAYERYYGVIKRLGVSPLSRLQLILAKIFSVLCIECLQAGVLVIISISMYGWHPTGNLLLVSLIMVIGTSVFSSLGLLMAGSLRAEVTLALANALYLFLLLGSGGLMPLTRFPKAIEMISSWLPGSALTTALQATMQGQTFPTHAILLLCAWGIIFLLLTMRTFRWE